MPFLSGIEMSSSTTSNSGARTSAIVSLPVAASAGDLHVGLVGDELLQAGAHDGVVVGDQDSDHGLWRARSRVG